jgi:hypothetical protein
MYDALTPKPMRSRGRFEFRHVPEGEKLGPISVSYARANRPAAPLKPVQ